MILTADNRNKNTYKFAIKIELRGLNVIGCSEWKKEPHLQPPQYCVLFIIVFDSMGEFNNELRKKGELIAFNFSNANKLNTKATRG